MTSVSRFSYTVYDKAGNVVTTGQTPDFNSRYSWSGITLRNGDYVELMQDNGSPFIIHGNTYITFEYILSATSLVRYEIMKQKADGTGRYTTEQSGEYTSGGGTVSYRTSGAYEVLGVYYPGLINFGSETITLTSAFFRW